MIKQKILRKNKYVLLLAVLLVLTILFSFIIKFKNSFNNKENLKKEFHPYAYFLCDSEKIYFSNRETLVLKESNTILIGKNEKELMNGYYDIKFDIDKEKLCIRINKLQKDNMDFRSLSDEYLNELKLFLIDLLNYNDIDEVIKIIKEEYIKLRSNMNCVTDSNDYIKINIGEYKINFDIEKNMLKVYIQM